MCLALARHATPLGALPVCFQKVVSMGKNPKPSYSSWYALIEQ